MPLALGAVAMLALALFLFVMYRTARSEEVTVEPTAVEQKEAQEDLFPETPPPGAARKDSKPEKAPPLNEH